MSGDGGNSGALVNDPVDVIIDKLLRYVYTMKFTRKGSCNALFSDILHAKIQACVERGTHSTHRHSWRHAAFSRVNVPPRLETMDNSPLLSLINLVNVHFF
jgi:hypothetical protein